MYANHSRSKHLLAPPLLLLLGLTVYTQTVYQPGKRQAAQEAERQANAIWETLVSNCGDSFFSVDGDNTRILEYKDVSIQTISRNLSKADQMNGIRFRGVSKFDAKLVRQYSFKSGAWSRWVTGSTDASSMSFDLQNANGKWTRTPRLDLLNRKSIPCKKARSPESLARERKQAVLNAEDREMFENERWGYDWGVSASRDPMPPIDKLRAIRKSAKNGNVLHNVAIGPGNSWAFITHGHPTSAGLPAKLSTQLATYNYGLGLISFTPSGGWLVTKVDAGNHQAIWANENFPQSVPLTLDGLKLRRNRSIFEIWSISAHTEFEWVVVYNYELQGGDNPNWVCRCSDDLRKSLTERASDIKQAELTPDGKGWVVLNGCNSYDGKNIPQSLVDKLDALHTLGREIHRVYFAPNGGWIVQYGFQGC